MGCRKLLNDIEIQVFFILSCDRKRGNSVSIFEDYVKYVEDVNFALNESSSVMITDRRGVIQFVNDKFCKISRYKREELIGKSFRMLNSGYHSKRFFEDMWKKIENGEKWEGEIRNERKDGQFYWMQATIVPFLNSEGVPYQYISILSDITERKKTEEALRLSNEKLMHLAFHDTLTGLPNRRYFYKKLENSLEVAKRQAQKIAVIYMDMDRFKNINDQFGHNEGDEVLKDFAHTVNTCLHPDVVFARQGGDEFTMLIPNIEEELVIQLANRIIKALENPIHAKHQLTVSMGISFYPKDGTTKDQLLKHADQALYQAKQAGKNTYKVYRANID